MSWGLFESRDAVWAPPPLARFPLERTKLARVGQAPVLSASVPPQPPAAPDLGRAGGGGFRKYRFILFKHPWHRQGPQNPQRGGERPQVTQRGGPGRAGLGELTALP